MNKFVRSFNVVVFFVLFVASLGVNAQDMTKSLEFGIFQNQASVASSSPVGEFTADNSLGFNLNVVFSSVPRFIKNIDFVIGVSTHSTKLKLDGTSLGDVSYMTFAGGARYRIIDDQRFQPYFGGGIHITRLNGSLADGTARVNQSGDGLGVYAEAGMKFVLPKDSVINSIDVGIKKFTNSSFVLETNQSAKISDVKLGSTRFGVSVIKMF